jgi:predicted MFS family arabinose efflux permease
MRALYLLAVLVWLSSTGFMAARFTSLVYVAQQSSSASLVGFLAASFAIFSAFASVPTGRLIDRRGAKQPLLWASSLLAVTVGVGAIWRDIGALFAIAIVAGLAHNTMVLAFQRLAGELGPPEERPAAFGLLGLGFSFSNLTAPVAAGFAIDHTGFTATYVIFALVPMLSFLFVWTDRLPWPPVHPAHRPGADGKAAPARGGSLALLRTRPLTRLYVACGLFEMAWMGFGFILPIHGTNLGFSASDIGLIAGAAGVMLMISRLFMTWLLRRLTPWQLLIAGMVLLGTGFIGIALTSQYALLIVSGAVIGLGQGIAGPMLNALIYEYAPAHEAGEAMGLRTLINNVSQGVIPLVAGGVGAMFGLVPVFWGMALSMIGIGWSSRSFWQARAQRKPSAP